MQRLIKLLENIGHTFVGVLYINTFFYFYAHNPKTAGMKPLLSDCRDEKDYKLLLDQWKKRGTYILFVGDDFGQALSGAIELLSKS